MTAPHADQITAEYLARLDAALAAVPEPRRQELMGDVREHVTEARSRLSNETDADLLNILERLGDATDMAAEEIGQSEAPSPTPRTSRALEIAAIVSLVLIWPVGVVLLWMSDKWSTRDKLIGTLTPPGGYLAILVLGPVMALGAFGTTCRTISDESGRVLSSTCPSGTEQTAFNIVAGIVVAFYLIGPILGAAYLAWRLSRRRQAAVSGDSNLQPPDPEQHGTWTTAFSNWETTSDK